MKCQTKTTLTFLFNGRTAWHSLDAVFKLQIRSWQLALKMLLLHVTHKLKKLTLVVSMRLFWSTFTTSLTHSNGEWRREKLESIRNAPVESHWKDSLGEVNPRTNNSHMKLRLITWLIFFFMAHVLWLYISTIKHQSGHTTPTDLSRWATAGQSEKFCPFPKDKNRIEGPAGFYQTRKQLTAHYGFQHKCFKSNNIHLKCQITVMWFIMLQNSF